MGLVANEAIALRVGSQGSGKHGKPEWYCLGLMGLPDVRTYICLHSTCSMKVTSSNMTLAFIFCIPLKTPGMDLNFFPDLFSWASHNNFHMSEMTPSVQNFGPPLFAKIYSSFPLFML